mmetsp:Transcript_33612/g.79791  ORF Transcript_33612/g.79791 Transcript_33612/m.79791 type:complete len:229 (+) Transcript_33612:95-781(+)
MPQNLLGRDFDGSERVPEYPFRDDGMLVWGAVVDFVMDYLRQYYESDYDVISDDELQAWWLEANKVGHAGVYSQGEEEEEPEIKNFDQLCMISTILIWVNTALHSSVAHGCYEHYGFPANRPTILHLPPPHRLDATTPQKFLSMLPCQGETVLVQAFMTIISNGTDGKSKRLGFVDEEWFSNDKVMEVYEKFRANLSHIEAILQVRNERRTVPYHGMRPENITQTVGT